ncbi:MAG TPA: MerR family transcriptional regulator [Nannocystaceae bacterium]|nr:MerR family transcriptional regulator [Nannocystaceae bacterium]
MKERGGFVKDGASTAQSAHGRYRIQTVAELTGVPASTLRAWEQRYGFPAPERTASAYRLYSEGDVARIARVRALCDGGMAAAEAVAAVLAEAGTSPSPLIATSSITASSIAPSSIAPSSSPTSVDLLELDARLRSALLLAPPRIAWAQTLAPAWATIRDAWQTGAIDRAEHRIAAEILGHAARDLLRIAQPAAANGFALVGGFADDDDLVPACGIALALQSAGLRVLSLGPRTSVGVLADAIARFDPRIVVLAVDEATARARELLDDYARASAGKRVVLCGPGAAALAPIAARHGVLVGDDDEVAARALAAR